MFTSGWSRSSVVGDVLRSHRRAASRIAARVGLVGFRFAVVESIPVISNAKYARRDGVPPQVPCPAVPCGDEDTQRRPIGRFEGVHPVSGLPPVHITLEEPPAGCVASSSAATPSRGGPLAPPPASGPP